MLTTIISGGQTGADRTALVVAREEGLLTGGWAPRGYRTEEGNDPSLALFGLKETAGSGYPERTRLNVQESDGTVWFGHTTSPGYKLTHGTCVGLGKPWIENPQPRELALWIRNWNIRILNVAGNRKSTNPDVVRITHETIMGTIHELRTLTL